MLGAALPFALRYHQQPRLAQTRNPEQGSTFQPPGPLSTTLPAARLAAMVGAMAIMGAIFGILQIGVTAYAVGTPQPGAAGLSAVRNAVPGRSAAAT